MPAGIGSGLALNHHFLDLGNGFGWIQALGTGFGAIQDRMTAVKPERILDAIKPLPLQFVATVDQPAIGLQQNGRSKITVAIPPVTWATRCATAAQNTFIQPIKLCPLFSRLAPFMLRFWSFGAQERCDIGVLGKKNHSCRAPDP